MTIPNVSKFTIIDKPEFLEAPERLVDLLETLKILSNEKCIKITLEEVGYSTLSGFKQTLKKHAVKAGVEGLKVTSREDNLFITCRG